jgi:hypothetical protein
MNPVTMLQDRQFSDVTERFYSGSFLFSCGMVGTADLVGAAGYKRTGLTALPRRDLQASSQ